MDFLGTSINEHIKKKFIWALWRMSVINFIQIDFNI